MKELIIGLLEKLIEMVRQGCFNHITNDDLDSIRRIIVKPDRLNATQAYKYLGVSRTRFYQLRTEKLIAAPKKEAGCNFLFYEREYLDKVKTRLYELNKL